MSLMMMEIVHPMVPVEPGHVMTSSLFLEVYDRIDLGSMMCCMIMVRNFQLKL